MWFKLNIEEACSNSQTGYEGCIIFIPNNNNKTFVRVENHIHEYKQNGIIS